MRSSTQSRGRKLARKAFAMDFEGGFVIDADDDVAGGGESVFKRIHTGDGLAFDGKSSTKDAMAMLKSFCMPPSSPRNFQFEANEVAGDSQAA